MTNEELPDNLSSVYHALRTARRRYVILLLFESEDEQLPVRSLARRIAALEQDVRLDHATGEPYRNVYNALSQTHLSTLSDAGLIIYDPDRQTVSPGPDFQLAALLISINRITYQTFRGMNLVEMDERIHRYQ